MFFTKGALKADNKQVQKKQKTNTDVEADGLVVYHAGVVQVPRIRDARQNSNFNCHVWDDLSNLHRTTALQPICMYTTVVK